MSLAKKIDAAPLLPENFSRWFSSRGWTPRAHQLELLSRARDGRSVLLIAPTGGGKTLAGFLPTLVELAERGAKPRRMVSTGKELRRSEGLHTLYISPLKALAVDIARNLETPVREMGLPIRIETRTGDTPTSKRQRQRRDPPDILLTTPEQLALLLASADAPYLFGSLRRVVLDELHALVTSKRGDLLSLGLARLWRLAPGLAMTGLSATVAEPEDLSRFLVPQPEGGTSRADLVIADGGAEPNVTMLQPGEDLPWAGHSARHAFPQIYELIKQHKMTLVFVNTRSQAEMIFHALWHINEDNARHRAASRLARCGAAPQGRGRHDRGPAARGGVHLVARSRRRLGRHRSRHQRRRAEGRLASSAAHRPRQPSARRAVARHSHSGQPLRGAGMQRRDRRGRRPCPGHAAAAHRRARRAGAARARPRLRRAVRRR